MDDDQAQRWLDIFLTHSGREYVLTEIVTTMLPLIASRLRQNIIQETYKTTTYIPDTYRIEGIDFKPIILNQTEHNDQLDVEFSYSFDVIIKAVILDLEPGVLGAEIRDVTPIFIHGREYLTFGEIVRSFPEFSNLAQQRFLHLDEPKAPSPNMPQTIDFDDILRHLKLRDHEKGDSE